MANLLRALRLSSVLVVLASPAILSSTALADNTAPSTAAALQPLIPVSGIVVNQEFHWFTPPNRLLPRDVVQFTIDSDGGNLAGSGLANVRVCLAPSTDDFGAEAAVNACGSPGYSAELPNVDIGTGKARERLTWTQPATNGFLMLVAGCGACGVRNDSYTITLERQIHRVVVGGLTVRKAGKRRIVRAPVLLTDNSPVSDGQRGYLSVTYGRKAPQKHPAFVKGGKIRVEFRPRTDETASVRICVRRLGANTVDCSTRAKIKG